MSAVVRSEPVRPVLVPTTFDQLVRFAELAANTDMVPKDFRGKPGNIMLACQMGAELGLSPMQSLNSIAVINGRPGIWGDGLIGICRQSILCQDIVETFEGEGETRAAVCIATRRGASPTKARFSVADAKRAGLWGKGGPWAQYPDRMLQNRARGFALRDAFPDLLRGLKTAEELRDTPPDTFRGTTVEAQPLEVVVTTREQINAAVPFPTRQPVSAEPKQTVGEFLSEVEGMLSAAHTADQVDAIAALPRIQRALTTLKPEPLDRLNAMIADALERTMPGAAQDYPATSSDDVPFAFPGGGEAA